MGKSRRLITLMLATSVSIGITAGLSGCSESEEEKLAEEQIRQLLEYDADIVGYPDSTISFNTKIENGEYLITFNLKNSYSSTDKITYSVDKDFFYEFKNNYNVVETSKEVNMVNELVETYDPVVVVSKNKEIKNDL